MFNSHYVISILLLLLTACSNAPRVTGNPAPGVQAAKHWSATAEEIRIKALSLTGVKYKYGGNSPKSGFDCSGFVRYVFLQTAHLILPRSAHDMSQLGQSIPVAQLQPGDLVFFNTLQATFSHVGIYLGEHRFIHAPSNGGHVGVVNMNERYWSQRYSGARRLTSNTDLPGEQPPSQK